jgi:EAL domain-containing protein (putative c-di-GMP-specific phosphodiesterase class I)
MEQDDGRVLLAPDIVPVAERLGLIRLVDHRVLELVVSELAASPSVELSLNISPDTTMDPNWWASIESLMTSHPGVAERLVVEITETVAIQDIDDLRGFVTRLKNFGSRIAIDDFGAGYTSFRNLRKLGVDILKIDGAFVQNIARSADDRAFVQTLIDLARRLNIKIYSGPPDRARHRDAAMGAGAGKDAARGGVGFRKRNPSRPSCPTLCCLVPGIHMLDCR